MPARGQSAFGDSLSNGGLTPRRNAENSAHIRKFPYWPRREFGATPRLEAAQARQGSCVWKLSRARCALMPLVVPVLHAPSRKQLLATKEATCGPSHHRS